MGLGNCQIYLDKPSGIYFPGETVSIRVEIIVKSPKSLRGIKIEFKGHAKVHWREKNLGMAGVEDRHNLKWVNFRAKETYFNDNNFIIGGIRNKPFKINAGKYILNAKYELPPIIPSSFEGEYGFVRYTIKVSLIRPFKFNQTIETVFTVNTQYDLNLSPKCREPATVTMEKYFCCLCCISGPLTAIFTVPRTGFISGQRIPMTLEVINASDVHVTRFNIKLQKINTFHAPSRYRETSEVVTIAKIKFHYAIKGNETCTCYLSFDLPALQDSGLPNCSIIDVHYEIQIIIGVEGMYIRLDGSLPIIIGSIPFKNFEPLPSTSI